MEETTRIEEQEQVQTEAAGSPLRRMLAPDSWCSRLLTPIGKVAIVPEKVANAFKLFVKRVGVGETFTLAELLMAGELLLGREVYGKPGDGIYMMSGSVQDARLGSSLMGRSVPGLYGLITAAGGAEIQLPAGIGAEQLAYDRMLLLREKDGDRIVSSGLVPLVRIGTVVPDRLRVGGEELTDLIPREATELTIGAEGAEEHRAAANALLGYSCCGMFPGTYFINLASDRGLAQMLAGALGIFEAMAQYRFALPPMRFNPNGNTGLVVPRPQLYSGDNVYVFHPKCGPDGLPVPLELNKLRAFLMENFRTKKIRSVLPLKGNAPDMLRRMGGDKLTYVEEMALPTDKFAMLGILPFGEQAPGTKVGSYRAE